jgi:hypothetical protein
MPVNFSQISGAISSAQQQVGSAVQQGLNAVGGAAGLAGKLSSTLNNLSNPFGLISVIRSISLPPGGEGSGKVINSSAQWGGAAPDWRVRLAMPTGTFFDESPALAPLIKTGGLIFPFTPTITMAGSANWGSTPITHQNYNFASYDGSTPSQITIRGSFNVETQYDAAYWLGVVHFLRSVTKMFTGTDSPAGNPPIILRLSGYGDYVFKNVPVVVNSFSIELPNNVDYIGTNVGVAAAGAAGTDLTSILTDAGKIAGLVAPFSSGLAKAAKVAGNIGDAINMGKQFLNSSGLAGGSNGSASYVPVKSDISITVTPIYSRESVRQFSLQKFVKGEYVNSGVGYL